MNDNIKILAKWNNGYLDNYCFSTWFTQYGESVKEPHYQFYPEDMIKLIVEAKKEMAMEVIRLCENGDGDIDYIVWHLKNVEIGLKE